MVGPSIFCLGGGGESSCERNRSASKCHLDFLRGACVIRAIPRALCDPFRGPSVRRTGVPGPL